MNGPERIADGDGGLEVELLRHARAERPADGDLDNVLAKVGSGAGVATGSGVAAGAAALHGAKLGLVVAKWVVVGALGGAAAVGGVMTATYAPSRRANAVVALRAAHGPERAAARAQSIVDDALEEDEMRIERADPSAATPSPALPRASAGDSAPAVAQDPSLDEGASSIGPEIVLLDRARAALASGKARDATAVLDEYERRFPAGALVPEARYVRIRALYDSGDHAAASRLAARFLDTNPSSPQARQVRELLGDAGTSR